MKQIKDYKKIFNKILLLSLFYLSSFAIALAQDGGKDNPGDGGKTNPGDGGKTNPGDITIDNPFGGGVDSLFDLLKKIINDILMPIGGVLAVLAFIYAGFLYVTARGKENQITQAHKALLYAAVGTVVLLGAWVIAKTICGTIGQLGGPVCPIS